MASQSASPLSSLYQNLLESPGNLEEELSRRALALATLAHEIKNPLAIISGYVEMLLSRKVGSLTERQEKILEETRSSCERLQKFAKEFLAYSALTLGNASAGLRLESCDLTGLVPWGETNG
jgi:signal transduction histidine kinase